MLLVWLVVGERSGEKRGVVVVDVEKRAPDSRLIYLFPGYPAARLAHSSRACHLETTVQLQASRLRSVVSLTATYAVCCLSQPGRATRRVGAHCPSRTLSQRVCSVNCAHHWPSPAISEADLASLWVLCPWREWGWRRKVECYRPEAETATNNGRSPWSPTAPDAGETSEQGRAAGKVGDRLRARSSLFFRRGMEIMQTLVVARCADRGGPSCRGCGGTCESLLCMCSDRRAGFGHGLLALCSI